jgi:hypothetical protein
MIEAPNRDAGDTLHCICRQVVPMLLEVPQSINLRYLARVAKPSGGSSHSDDDTVGSRILRAINQPLAVMLDGQNLDAGGG